MDEESSFDDPVLDNQVITGYPADKGFGEMRTTGSCTSWDWPVSGTPTSVAHHDCDSFGGQYASALLRPATPAFDVYARGVHIYGCIEPSCNFNGVNIFLTRTSYFQSTKDWSGRW